jgi:hypothetical protein
MSTNYTNLLIKADYNNFAISYGMTIKVYYITNYSIKCTFTLNSTIYDLRISNNSIYVTTFTSFYHYNISLCILFDSYYTGGPYKISLQIQSNYNIV